MLLSVGECDKIVISFMVHLWFCQSVSRFHKIRYICLSGNFLQFQGFIYKRFHFSEWTDGYNPSSRQDLIFDFVGEVSNQDVYDFSKFTGHKTFFLLSSSTVPQNIVYQVVRYIQHAVDLSNAALLPAGSTVLYTHAST